MKENKLRVGIIGIGFWSMLVHVPALKKTGRAELVAISRRTPERLELARQSLGVSHAYTDWRDLIERNDLDAVIVSTAHVAHAASVIAALEKGLHVLVEKPMAVTSSDGWDMVQAAERAERVLMVGYDRRCNGLYRTIKSKLEKGLIGAVRQVNTVFAHDYAGQFQGDRLPPVILDLISAGGVPPGIFGDGSLDGYWRKNTSDKGGGMFIDSGSHFVDLALWLGGAAPEIVVAFKEASDSITEKYMTVQARLSNGVHISLTANATFQWPEASFPMQLTIIGDIGMISCDGSEAWLYKDGKRERIDAELDDYSTVEAFITTILDNAPNLSPAAEAAHVVALTEAAYHSADEDRIVKVHHQKVVE